MILREGRAWTDDEGYQHPKNWAVWDAPAKTARGLIWEDAPEPYDERFYHGRDSDGKLIPKSLADINEVDDEGNAINDSDGNQIVTLGLKSVAISSAKDRAGSLLQPTDWMVIRLQEDSSKSLASKYSTYRAAIRTSCAAIETKINDCSSLDEFMALWVTPVDSDGNPTGNSPINSWPDVVE